MTDLLTDPEFLKSIIPTTLSLIVTGLVSVLIGIFLEKYRNKLTLIDYRIFFSSVAKATSDNYWGNIKVLYNGTEVRNLNFTTIEVRNSTKNDIAELNLRFRADPETIIIAQEGYVNETNEPLFLKDDYFKLYQEVLKENQEYEEKIENQEIDKKPKQHLNRLDYVSQNKIYHIPVLNRKTTLYFNFLISHFGENPISIDPIINKKGVKLIKRDSVEQENKNTLNIGSLIGWILYTFFIGFTLYLNPDSTALILFIYFISLIYVFIGMGLYKIYKYIRNILI